MTLQSIFATLRGYIFNLVVSILEYGKLLHNLEVVNVFKYSNSYQFNGKNFFFLEFNNFNL